MHLRSFILPLSIVAAIAVLTLAGLHVWRRSAEADALSRSIRERSVRIDEARARYDDVEARLAPLREELNDLRVVRAASMARAAGLSEQLANTGSGSDPSQPPETLPEWNHASPFVWLPKAMLPQLPVQGFESDGSLKTDVAEVLTLEPEQVRVLNGALTGILKEYRAAEMTRAQPIEEHLPGIADREGRKLTIRVESMGDLAGEVRARYEASVVEVLGSQRSDILLKASEGWLGETFNVAETEPRIVSVVRAPDGTYSLSMKSGDSGMSVGGANAIEDYIPIHLRPLFLPVLSPDGLELPR